MSLSREQLKNGMLGLAAAVAAVFGTVMAFGAMRGRGAGACILWAVVMTAGAALALIRRPMFRRIEPTLWAVFSLFLGLCLRMTLFDYISPDYVSFLGPWTEQMRVLSVREALTTPIGDYNMPYLYFLLVISRLPIYDLYSIKLFSMLFDVLLAIAVGKLSRLVSDRDEVVLIAFLAALFAPTVFLNSGYWGQCDGVYACLGLWGLYCGIRKKGILSVVLFACSFAFKLQAVFLIPVLAFLLLDGRIRLRDLIAFPATFLIIMLPALLAGRGFGDTFGIYLSQTESYPYLSLNAPSFWSLVPNDFFHELNPAPVLLAGAVTLGLLFLFLQRKDRFDRRDLIALGLIFSLAIPWLLPRMHERYFYLAEVLSICYAACYPRRFPVAVIQLWSGFLAYCSYLFGGMRILSNELVAAVLGLQLIYLVFAFLRDTGGSHMQRIHQQGGNDHES